MSAEEEEAGVHAAKARALQEECQAELNQAMPALHGGFSGREWAVSRGRVRNCTQAAHICCLYICVLYTSTFMFLYIQMAKMVIDSPELSQKRETNATP